MTLTDTLQSIAIVILGFGLWNLARAVDNMLKAMYLDRQTLKKRLEEHGSEKLCSETQDRSGPLV